MLYQNADNNCPEAVKSSATNLFITCFLTFGMFFGVLFYDFIYTHFGFSYIDEILALLLCIFTLFCLIHDRTCKASGYWFWLFAVFAFYLVYSFVIHSNTKSAIIQDAIVELKPFLGFFCAYTIGKELTKTQKRIIQYACYVSIFLLLLTTRDQYYFIGHPSRYATCATFIAMLYLYVSDFTKKNLIIFLAILSVAVLSTRSKAYGFVVFSTILSLLFYNNIRFRLSFKYVLYTIIFIGGIILVTWEKIDYYFIYGAQNIETNDIEVAFARPAMYWGAWQILCDYVPFGSGFASFGTYFSAEHYSAVYYTYGLNIVHGLSEEVPDFIADAYYPSLAQYGLAGIGIFIYFWVFVIRKAASHHISGNKESHKLFFLILSIVTFFAIELVADTTLTHNRGFFILLIMGLSLRQLMDMKSKGNE